MDSCGYRSLEIDSGALSCTTVYIPFATSSLKSEY